MAAPATLRASGSSLPRDFNCSVIEPALPTYLALTCSSSGTLAVAARVAVASFSIAWRSLMGRLFRSLQNKRPAHLGSGPFARYLQMPLRAAGRFRLLDKSRERRLVHHGKVGQHFAIHFNRGLFQAMHEGGVVHAAGANGRIDAGNPQGAEHALLVAAIAVGVLPRLHHRFLGDTEYGTAAAAIALRQIQYFLVTRFGGYTTFNSWHVESPLRVGQHGAHA